MLTGSGEAGATITVQGPNGQVGTGVVQANGTFTITLTSPQNDGQLLVVRQSDPTGNLSASISLTAPDTTPPAAPLATINANGTAYNSLIGNQDSNSLSIAGYWQPLDTGIIPSTYCGAKPIFR